MLDRKMPKNGDKLSLLGFARIDEEKSRVFL